ncbi:GAD-like domain-containing protein [Pokkaliibacter sp. MBI-7]|uniref:GAD-like domain-containing protein n=1 Tax=Pokkaliibacter sp. MBI-7 TaxID=3040600 RepID=UPI00244AB198|nr:GAD-like domain-containing protein [Pokkaliibacter sp. MBI-7]MDH2434376.1 GAD-like domain-containing protein [Pokkaliibacter sp. MBI-7]
MYQDLDYFLYEFGTPTSSKSVPSTIIEKYRTRLPAALIEFWNTYGLCSFNNGLLWFVNPDDYEEQLESWIGDTPIMEFDAFHVIARNAFGELYLWGKKSGYSYEIAAPMGWLVQKKGHEGVIASKGEDAAFGQFLACSLSKKIIGMKSTNNTPLFDECIQRFGPLKEDECFGFVPALFAGGENTIDHIQKLNIFTHLSILAQMADRQIMDTNALIKTAF